jgi:predicted MPP superfamily phosphohydrolase
MAADPDVVLIAGDLFQGTAAQFERNREPLRRLLTSLDVPGGVFLVQGDVDDGPGLGDLVAGTPVTYLWNEVTTITVGDRTIRLAALGLGRGRESLAALAELTGAPPDAVRLVLSHRPDPVRDVPDGAADLVVAGHTHGGQIQLPWIGPLNPGTDLPRSLAAGGLHEFGGTPIYVSRGVGHEQQGAPQIRFLAPPNVGLIELG